jgi:putative nucleotidyltransferase with HDIG domain
MAYKIMVVDDEPANLRLLERLFRRDYQIITAASGDEALQLLNHHDVALMITDQRMPGMTGIELLQRTTEFRPHMVRMILTGYTDMAALVEAINCGQVYKYVTKPWNNDELRMTVERALEHYETNKSRHELEQLNKRLSIRLQEMTRGVVRAIADSMEARDEHIYGHARRVSGYATAIGRRMRLQVELLEQISLAAFLHDIGKIGTPDSILLKPTTFTDEERACIQLHSERGARILAGVPEMEEVATFVRHHHEHFDGSGYPEGLCGEQIPLAARIILVADAYDAMTSPRPFREAWNHEAAIEKLQSEAGLRFDPEVVRAFCGLESLAKIRDSIAQGSWGERLSPALLPSRINSLTLAELIAEVETEPVLAALVLMKANAKSRTGPTANLPRACTQLGETEVRFLLAQNCTGSRTQPQAHQLWSHSLRCAEAARLLAERTKIVDAQEAYALSLLHDIGEGLLCAVFPEEMENILWLSDESRLDREVIAFGVDHAQVGQWILELCGLPRQLTSAVQTHHDVMRINAPVALLLHVADAIARAEEPQEVAAIDALGSDRLALLHLSRADLARVHERISVLIEQRLARTEFVSRSSGWEPDRWGEETIPLKNSLI